MRLMRRRLHARRVPHCVFHPSTLPSHMISRLGWIWSMELTRLIQHGLKHVFRPFLALLLLFWCPLSLPFIPRCPLARTIFLSLTVSVNRLILYYCCHLIGSISVIRSFFFYLGIRCASMIRL